MAQLKDLMITGSSRLLGVLNVNGAVTIDNTVTVNNTVTVDGIVAPAVPGVHNLGTAANPWRNVQARYFKTYDLTNMVQTSNIYTSTVGTADTVGSTYAMIGNSTASGTAGNSKGVLRLYDTTSYYTDIRTAQGQTASRIITFPDKTGLAVVTTTNAYGTTQLGSIVTMTTSDGLTSTVLKLLPDNDTTNNYGNILTIGAGGDTYIGGGESVTNLQAAIGTTTSENMYVSADTNVYIASNCNTVANRQTFTFNSSGALIVPTGTAYTTYKARNIAANTTAMTAGTTTLANGNIYLQYS